MPKTFSNNGLNSNKSNDGHQTVSVQEIVLETSDNENKEIDQCHPDETFWGSTKITTNDDSILPITYNQKFGEPEQIPYIPQKVEYNEFNKPFINELKLIPRNKIGAFKAFRNSTFKLVPTSSSSQTLMNNSNNSNRFNIGRTKGFNSNVNSNDAYINKTNRKIMLKKITELANSFKDGDSREFKRIIPHPILDDKRYGQIFQDTLSNDGDNSENSNILNAENVDKSELILRNENIKLGSQLSLDNPIDIENYENILINKLKEIRDLKHKSNHNNENLRSTKHLPEFNFTNKRPSHEIEVHMDKMGTERVSDSPKRTLSRSSFCFKDKSDITFSKEKLKMFHSLSDFREEIYESEKKLNKSTDNLKSSRNIHIKSKVTPLDGSEKGHYLTNGIVANEIEVCLEEHHLSKHLKNNFHIPLYFKCRNGKKIKFKIRYLSKIMKAQQAFCSRMCINSLSHVQFTTEAGQIITDTDSPYSLHLKANDVIIVSICPSLKENSKN